jgi:ABC-type lipoprotein release transport system permease subunit
MALRDLRAMAGRAVLIVLVIGAGIGTGTGILVALRDVRATRDAFYQEHRLADVDVRLSEPQPSAELQARADQAGAARSATRLILDGLLSRGSRRTATEVVGMPTRARLDTLAVVEGHPLTPRVPRGALLEADFAQRTGVHVGDHLSLQLPSGMLTVEVRGLARSPEYLLATSNPEYLIPQPGSLAVVFLPLGGLQAVSGNDGRVNDLAADLPDGLPAQRLAALTEGLPVETVIPRDQQFSLRFTDADLRSFSTFVPILATVFTVVGFLIVLLSFRRLVESRRQPLGALRALGYSRRVLAGTVLGPAALLGCVGAVVAVGMTAFVARLVAGEYTSAVGFPNVRTTLPAELVALTVALSVGAALLGALAPAISLTRLTPAATMRDTPTHFAVPAWVERATATSSTWSTYVARSLLRRPLLTGATILSVAAAIGLGAALNIVTTSTDRAITAAFAHQRWEYSVDFTTPLPDDDARALARRSGAEHAQPVTKGFTRLVAAGSPADTELVAPSSTPALLSFDVTAGWPPGTGEIALSEQTAEDLGVHVGSRVRAISPSGIATLRVAGEIRTLASGQSYVTPATGVPLIGRLATGTLVTGSPATRAGLERDPLVARVTSRRQARSSMHDLVKELTGLIDVLLAISLGVGALFLISSMTLSFLDRQGEFATLRALGNGRAQLAKIVLGEGLGIAALASLLAVPAALALAWPLTRQIGNAWFRIGLHMTPSDFTLAIVGGLVLAVGASLLALRRVQALNLGAFVRARFIG